MRRAFFSQAIGNFFGVRDELLDLIKLIIYLIKKLFFLEEIKKINQVLDLRESLEIILVNIAVLLRHFYEMVFGKLINDLSFLLNPFLKFVVHLLRE